MTLGVRVLQLTWLCVAVFYLRWAAIIVRGVVSTPGFVVAPWTVATPFATLILGPVGAVLASRKGDVLGRALLCVTAANWLLWAVLDAAILRRLGSAPSLLKGILLLSVLTLTLVLCEWFSSQRRDHHPGRTTGRA